MAQALATTEQSRLIARIRDALRGLGYPVPPGGGPGTLGQLADCAPFVSDFAATVGPEFEARVSAVGSPEGRAALVAERAEFLAASLGSTGWSFVRVVRGVAHGVRVWQAVSRDFSAFADLFAGFARRT